MNQRRKVVALVESQNSIGITPFSNTQLTKCKDFKIKYKANFVSKNKISQSVDSIVFVTYFIIGFSKEYQEIP